MEIKFKLRKYVSYTVRECFRSIRGHPFLVGFLCFLIIFYRLSPYMFSVLLYVSPVFVSTAILLGTLLSFGHPNLPEIETEDEIFHETAPDMIVERSLEVDLENVETMETGEGSIVNDESYSDVEVVENHYVLIPGNEGHLDLDDESSEPDSSDSERADVNLPSHPSLSSWAQVDGVNEEEQVGDSSDSGSDLAESSSPDTSMAEIDSVLHELHPLLDNENEDSEDSENEDSEDSEVGEDDDEEEDERRDEEEEAKPEVTWTEEDNKNVMDLGNSEIERNVRLENLMLRMRARKNMRMMMEEIKLINSESCDLDLPFNLPPIRTTRSNLNLYDLSHDFPDSAPSIMLPRRNSFDIPHDEEPSFAGGRLQEFVSFRSKRHLFRSQGRFNARPSFFAPDRQENKEVSEEDFEGGSDVISENEHISVGHGSQSSEEEESQEDEVINRDVEFDNLDYSRVSSSSSLEASERVYIEPSNQTITNEVIEGVQVAEPVYDLTPTAIRNNIASYITSIIHVEPDRFSTEGTSHEMETNISVTTVLAESSTVHPVKEQEYGPTDFSNTREHEDINSDFLGAGVTSHAPIPAEPFVENLMDSDLDHVTLLNTNISPLNPDYASTTSIVSEASLPLPQPYIDQIIVEGTDENEIKDCDEEVLSELDSIIDISIKQWEFFSTEYEEDIDLVAGGSFPSHDALTSNLNIPEFHSVEMNTMCSETSEKDNSAYHQPIPSDDKNYEHNDSYARNLKARSMEDASLNYEQVDIVMENNALAGSGYHHIPLALNSAKTLEPMPLGSTNLLQRPVLDENVQKKLMQDSTHGPLEVEAHLVVSPMDKETSAEPSVDLAAAKLHNKDRASSTADSSCSSHSRSHDSDEE